MSLKWVNTCKKSAATTLTLTTYEFVIPQIREQYICKKFYTCQTRTILVANKLKLKLKKEPINASCSGQ